MTRRGFIQTSAAILGGLALARGLRASRSASSVRLRPAPSVKFPSGYNSNHRKAFLADCKSPSHWDGNTLYVFNSWEQPSRASGPDLFHLSKAEPVRFDAEGFTKLWIWIESTYRDDDGTLYAWFHNEVPDECPPRKNDLVGYPVVVRIGALRSKDNGSTWNHLGFIFEPSPATIRCDTQRRPDLLGGRPFIGTHLDEYVMVLNRVTDTSWATEGIYICFNRDLADPTGWSMPQKIMDREQAIHADPGRAGNGWYGQVMGTGQGETDKLAGRVARLFVDGQSRWEIEFERRG